MTEEELDEYFRKCWNEIPAQQRDDAYRNRWYFYDFKKSFIDGEHQLKEAIGFNNWYQFACWHAENYQICDFRQVCNSNWRTILAAIKHKYQDEINNFLLPVDEDISK